MKVLALCGTLTACLIALASPAAVPFSAQQAVKAVRNADADAIQGVWRRVMPGGTSPGQLLMIDGNRLTVQHDTDRTEEAEFTLDPTATPKAINAKFESGWAFGIYELTGDTLRLCISEPGPTAVRPTTFQAFGKSVSLAEYRRVDDGAKGK